MTIQKKTATETIRKALLIDDNVFCQRVQSHCLTELAYQVEIVSNAKTAIDRVKNQYFDLIILDLGLPDQSGEEVITAARDFLLNQHTPLIVATAHANAFLQQQCLHLGADVVFIKPFTQQTLAKAIEYCRSMLEV